jgi:tRNA pseudouridine32 synthase/23S rRNA pseudouridine746 synthase
MIEPALIIVADFPEFVVVDKPAGLLSVPGRTPNLQDCITERVKVRYPQTIAQPAVHRLDMDTSGLMVVAKTTDTHRVLSKQFIGRSVEKKYVALLDGVVQGERGTIELPFRLDPEARPQQVYDLVHGKMGTTHWRRLAVEGGRTRVEFTPVTGRTHQLRLHASHEKGLGCPIKGDRLYGTNVNDERLCLHACFLSFDHPQTGERLTFTSPVPF